MVNKLNTKLCANCGAPMDRKTKGLQLCEKCNGEYLSFRDRAGRRLELDSTLKFEDPFFVDIPKPEFVSKAKEFYDAKILEKLKCDFEK